MAVQIQLRRDTASNWTSNNPTLAAGEFAIETDTDKYKIGDGSTAWTSLGYSSLPSNAVTTAGGVTITGTMTHGADGTGADVRFNSGTAGDYAMWDASEEKLILEGTNNATVLDVTDGNVVIADGTLSVSGAITATGGVTGNVTGNASGTAATVTTAAQSAITSVGTLTGLTMGGTVDAADQIVQKPVLKDVGETCVANGTSGATDTIDLQDGNVHNVTLTANCTFTFSNPPASGTSGAFTLFLNQDGTGSRTATWPNSVKWAGGTAPTLTTTASRTDILVFTTIDGGTIWYGAVSGQDFQ